MGIIENIKYKLQNKEYAVFVDKKGYQRNIIRIPQGDIKFKHNNKLYIKNKKEFSNLQIKETKYILGTINKTYYIYDEEYSEPLRFTKNNIYHNKATKEPYIAQALNSIFETKVLSDINKPKNDLFGELDAKKIFIGLIIVVAIIYFLTGGTVQ